MRLGNGKFETTVFNSRLQPTQIGLGSSVSDHGLLKLDYSYGTTHNNGNVLSQTITVPTVGANTGFVATQTYTYDSLNRIKVATENVTPHGGSSSQSWKQAFTYDRYGNRNFDEADTTTLIKNCGTSPNFTVCAADRKVLNPEILASNNRIKGDQDGDSINDYTFDASGNTTHDADGRTFIYDAENKQVEVRDSQQNVIGQYQYDGDGKRVKKVVPGTGELTIFVYDAAGKLVAEYSTVIAPPSEAKVSYLTNDHLGSPRINTDQNGSVTARHDYHPFGEEIAGTGGRTQGLGYTADDVRKQFTSYERDIETDLDFAEERFYSSKLGRFMSTDNILISEARVYNPQIWNSYSYVGNNPLNFTDPNGMERIQLGRDEADIEKDIEAKQARKKELEAQKKALKQEKKTLSKDEYKSRKASINNEIKQTNSSINTLNVELAGTKMVNTMLQHLRDKGEDQGLQLSDFSVSTDPKNDFPDAKFKGIGNINAFVLHRNGQPAYGGQIFINAKGPLYRGAINGGDGGTSKDWLLYGASVLRHEKWHRDAPTHADRISERLAYQAQLPILRKFKNDFDTPSFYQNRIKTVTQRGQ